MIWPKIVVFWGMRIMALITVLAPRLWWT